MEFIDLFYLYCFFKTNKYSSHSEHPEYLFSYLFLIRAAWYVGKKATYCWTSQLQFSKLKCVINPHFSHFSSCFSSAQISRRLKFKHFSSEIFSMFVSWCQWKSIQQAICIQSIDKHPLTSKQSFVIATFCMLTFPRWQQFNIL